MDHIQEGTAAFTELSKVLQYGTLGLCFFMAAGMLVILGFWMWLNRGENKERSAANHELAKALQSLADATARQGSAIVKLQESSEDTGKQVALMKQDLDHRACCASNAALKALQDAFPTEWQSRLVKAQAAGA